MPDDLYAELGVAKDASAEDIKKAYRALARKYHPDANQGDAAAEERFKRISAAFDLLGDEDKRKKFDRGEIDADGREINRGFAGGGHFGGGHGGGGHFGGGHGGAGGHGR